MEFVGRFRPQAPGCSFNTSEADRALRSGSAAQMAQAAATLRLPQLGELAVSHFKSHADFLTIAL